MLKRYIPDWIELKVIGRNKLSKTSYYWIILLPILVKIVSPLNKNLTFQILNESISLSISLPFSWKVLFLASIFFSAGNLLFNRFCPNLIKSYNSPIEYEDEGKTNSTLRSELIGLIRQENPTYLASGNSARNSKFSGFILRNFHEKKVVSKQIAENVFNDVIEGTERIYSAFSDFSSGKSHEKNKWLESKYFIADLKSSFWELKSILKNDLYWMRLFITIFYAIALGLTLLLIIQNIIFVMNFILS